MKQRCPVALVFEDTPSPDNFCDSGPAFDEDLEGAMPACLVDQAWL